VRNIVSFTTWAIVVPAAASAIDRFSNACRTCASGSPAPTTRPSASAATCPEVTTSRPVTATAWLYPFAGGSPSGLMKCSMRPSDLPHPHPGAPYQGPHRPPAGPVRHDWRAPGKLISVHSFNAAGEPAPAVPPPAIPVSAGALIFDRAGRLLILKPTYKSGWTIPGGVMEADGETPWQACRREVREECGIEVSAGRLACMDFRAPRPGRPGGIRYLFDCGVLADQVLAAIVVQPDEVSEHQLAPLPDALDLLRRPIRRRVRAATRGLGAVAYLEDGRPVPGVTGSAR